VDRLLHTARDGARYRFCVACNRLCHGLDLAKRSPSSESDEVQINSTYTCKIIVFICKQEG